MIYKLLKLSDKLEAMKLEAEADKVDYLIRLANEVNVDEKGVLTKPLTWNEWFNKWRNETAIEADTALKTWLYSFWEEGKPPPSKSETVSLQNIPERKSPAGMARK